MKLQLEIMIQKYKTCLLNLDNNQTCDTCKFQNRKKNPCKNCYDSILGLPINPTEWKK